MMSFSSKILNHHYLKSMLELFGILLLLYVCKKRVLQKGGMHMRTVNTNVIRVHHIKLELTLTQWIQLSDCERTILWAEATNQFACKMFRTTSMRPKRFVVPEVHVKGKKKEIAIPYSQLTTELNGTVVLHHIIPAFLDSRNSDGGASEVDEAIPLPEYIDEKEDVSYDKESAPIPCE